MRTPTEKQYDRLRPLGSGSAGLSWSKGEADPLLRHGWITATFDGKYYQWVQITPTGLHALAEAVERYGLPEIRTEPKPTTTRRVCASCGSDRYRFKSVPVDDAVLALAGRQA